MTDRNPQAEQMASDAMVRTLQAQADAIWPLESPLFDRYGAPARILDVGCGTGVVTARIADRYPAAEVTGVDVHEPHLARARSAHADRPHLRFRADDAYELDQPDRSVDLLVCRHVLQSLPQPELVIAEMRRVLAPGGRLHLLVEDYGMIHFAGTRLDTDRFWRDGCWALGDHLDNDLRIGRKMAPILHAHGFEAVAVDYLPIDTLRTDRATFAAIWEAWAEAYTDPMAEHTALSRAEVREHWADMVDAIRDPRGYALWQVPVWTAVWSG